MVDEIDNVQDDKTLEYKRGQNPNSQKNILYLLRQRDNMTKIRLQGIRQFFVANRGEIDFQTLKKWYMSTFQLSLQTLNNDLNILQTRGELEKEKIILFRYKGNKDVSFVSKFIKDGVESVFEKEKQLIFSQPSQPSKEQSQDFLGSDDNRKDDSHKDLIEF